MCAIALIFAVAGCLTPILLNEMRRQALIAEIDRRGHAYFNTSPPLRWSVVGRLLPERYQHVQNIGFSDKFPAGGTPVGLGGYDFGSLVYFPELSALGIHGRVDEGALLELPRLANLESLVLNTHQANDAVVRHAAATYPGLTSLGLFSDSVTEASIDEICRLVNLEKLELEAPRVPAQALHRLRVLKHLRRLELQCDSKTIRRAEMEELAAILPVVFLMP